MANNQHDDLGFVPDSHQEAPAPELDPNAQMSHDELGFTPEPAAPENVSLPEAVLGEIGMGASAGTLPKISAAVGSVLDNPLHPTQTYDKRLAETRDYVKQMEEQHPNVALASQLAGGFLTPIGEIGELKQGAGLAAKLGQAAKQGAVYGGAEGFGNSDKDALGELKDTAEGATVGGLLAPAVAGVTSGTGKVLKTVGNYLGESPIAQKMASAFQFGQENPDFYKATKRKDVINNLRGTVEDEVIPLVDDTLEGKASDMYDEAKKASQEKVPTSTFLQKVSPSGEDAATNDMFNTSDASRYVLKDLTRTLSNLDKDGVVDVNKAFELRNKVQDLMTKVSPKRNPVDGDAYNYLNNMKSNLDAMLEDNYGIPMKDLNSEYSKIGDFKAEMGTDIRRENVQDYKNARSNALDSLSDLFMKASADPSSDEALQLERAYGKLKEGSLVPQQDVDDSLDAVQKAAKDASIVRTMTGGGMHVKGTSYITSLGLGPKAIATQAAAGAGAVTNAISQPVKSVVYNTAAKLNSVTPEMLKTAASQVGGATGSVLNQLANKPEGTRNALLFTMMQQPAYQGALKKIFNDRENGGDSGE